MKPFSRSQISHVITILTCVLSTLIVLHKSFGISSYAISGAKVLTPLTLRNIQSLSFGQIVPSEDSAGQVEIKNDTMTYTGIRNIVPNSGAQSAKFEITGEPNTYIQIQVDEAVQLSSESSFMYATLQAENYPIYMPEIGKFNLVINAKLSVDADQAIGSYIGTYFITLSYT